MRSAVGARRSASAAASGCRSMLKTGGRSALRAASAGVQVQKMAAEELGYNEKRWNKDKHVFSDDMFWSQLNPRQRWAAKVIGYAEQTWDDATRAGSSTPPYFLSLALCQGRSLQRAPILSRSVPRLSLAKVSLRPRAWSPPRGLASLAPRPALLQSEAGRQSNCDLAPISD